MDERGSLQWPDGLLGVINDRDLAIQHRLRAVRALALTRATSDQDEATNILLDLVTNEAIEPVLAHTAGRSLARLVGEEGVDLALFRTFSGDALSGFNDECERIDAERRGENQSFDRLTDGATRQNVRIALDGRRDLEERVVASAALGNASQDEESFATEALVQLAKSVDVEARLAEAVGRGYARLRLRQGILEEVDLPYFTEPARAGYAAEAKELRTN